MSAVVLGSAADRALDASTKGVTGRARPGFHLAFVMVRGIRNGMPSATTHQERCTCSKPRNHGRSAVAR